MTRSQQTQGAAHTISESGDRVIVESRCIRDGCGARYNVAEPETRDISTLRAFWKRYCPKHRLADHPQTVFVNVPAEQTQGEGKEIPQPTQMMLELAVQAASEALRNFPKGPMGLTPDSVKQSAEYKAAKARFSRAFQALREFNSTH
jgi:hypothetical protein